MTGFKMMMPLWCPKYGQATRIEGPDRDGDWKVWFEDGASWYYCSSGEFYTHHSPERCLRNGIMPGKMPQLDEPYVTVDSDGCVCCWADLDEAVEDQRKYGGTIIDIRKVGPEAHVQPPKEKTVWINIYPSGMTAMHDTREEADKKSRTCNYRIACKKVTFTEGEGL